ncbi:MAG: thiamine diphosphokinase [SAR324 cluster bacterium]|nr:thiamine diphosphokinase [SAR324 cluster bacterium]
MGLDNFNKYLSEIDDSLLILNVPQVSDSVLKYLWNKSNFKIATDGAINFLEPKKLFPDIVIGDMDSLDKSTTNKSSTAISHFLQLSDQETTDSEKALHYLLEKHQKKLSTTNSIINILPIAGSRIDHVCYNLHLMELLFTSKLTILGWTDVDIIFNIANPLLINGFKGHRISLSGVSGEKSNMSTKGLAYEIDSSVWQEKRNFSISNLIVSEQLLLSPTQGMIRVYLEHKLNDSSANFKAEH